jgi:hypothetical protein
MLKLPAHDRYDYSPIDKRVTSTGPRANDWLFMLLSTSSISLFLLAGVMIPYNAAAPYKHNAITLGATTACASEYGAFSVCSIK